MSGRGRKTLRGSASRAPNRIRSKKRKRARSSLRPTERVHVRNEGGDPTGETIARLQAALEQAQRAISSKDRVIEEQACTITQLRDDISQRPPKAPSLSFEQVTYQNNWWPMCGLRRAEVMHLITIAEAGLDARTEQNTDLKIADQVVIWCAKYHAAMEWEKVLDLAGGLDSSNTRKKMYRLTQVIYGGFLVDMPSHPLPAKDGEPITFHKAAMDLHGLHTDTKKTLGADEQLDGLGFDSAAVLIEDGSGTPLHDVKRGAHHTSYYCFWKSSCMARWFIVVDVYGYILFCSMVYPGAESDIKGRQLAHIDDWLKETFGLDGKIDCPDDDCDDQFIIITGGDKGYRDIKPFGKHNKIALTMTAATETILDDVELHKGGKGEKKRGGRAAFKAQSYHILHPRYSHYRSVVERVIHGIKLELKFLAGARYLRQVDQLSELLCIACARSNRTVKRDRHHYFNN